MSDITHVLTTAEDATDTTAAVLADLDGTLGSVPTLLGSIPAQIGGLTEMITVGVVPSLWSEITTAVGPTVDLLLDQTAGVVASAGGVLDSSALTLDSLGADVSEVTDELPARLSALAGIAIVGGDVVLTNLAGIIGVGLGDLVPDTADSTLGSLGLVVDGLVGDIQDPLAATVDSVTDTTSTVDDVAVTDANDALGHTQSASNNLVIATQGLAATVPADSQAAIEAILADTTGSTVPDVVDTVTFGNSSIVGDPLDLVGSVLDDVQDVTDSVTGTVDDRTGLGVSDTVHGVTDLLG